MKEPVDHERSRQFNRVAGISATLAFVLALLLVGLYYGCAKSSRPEHPSSQPSPSGLQTRQMKVVSLIGTVVVIPWEG